METFFLLLFQVMVIESVHNIIIEKEKERILEGEYQQRAFPEQTMDPLKMEVMYFCIGFSLLDIM